MQRRRVKIYLGVLLALALIGGGMSAWVLSITGDSVLVIESGAPLEFSSTLDTNDINLSSATDDVTVSDYVDVENKNRGKTADVTISCTPSSVDTDGTDDCVFDENDITPSITSDFALVPGETKRIWVNATVSSWSCAGNYTTSCTITATKQ